MEKQCFKCKETKLLSEFYAHKAMSDGHLGKCKTCAKRDVAERSGRLQNNPAWLRKERERCRIKQERYRKLGVAVKTTQATREKWAAKNPHKIMAHKLTDAALRRGEINPQTTCEKCGGGGKIEKHHPDYSKPLLIQWLCTKCHGETRHKDNFDIVP